MVMPDKSRYVYLYLPSQADKARWHAMADKAKTPLSTWAIEVIEATLAENEEFRTRGAMAKELDDLKKENQELRADLRQKTIVLDRYENELRRFRSQAFLDEGYQGVRRYSAEIVDLLKARGQVDSYALLDALGVDPREADMAKAVSKQLEELEAYGIVTATGRGWKWIG